MNRIDFVRLYTGHDYGVWADIVYKSRRVRTVKIHDIPQTVSVFMVNADCRMQDDSIHGVELIYEMEV